MNREQGDALKALVRTYLDAYDERMHPAAPGAAPRLWADRPIRAEYRAVLDHVLALPVAERHYSKESIEELVDGLLTETLRDRARVDAEVDGLADLFNHQIVTRLYVPLEGVASDAPVYDVGALRLIRLDDQAFENLIVAPFAEAMNMNPYYKDDSKRGFIENHRSDLLSLKNRVCVGISANLDIPRTFTFGEDSAIGALCDFLQFAASLFVSHDKNLKIVWATDAGVVWRHSFAHDSRRYSNRNRQLASVAHPFTLSAERVAELTALGLDRIANLVGRDIQAEYDQMLQRAVRWFAKGEREEHPDDRKLSYVTAIDLFFSKTGGGATKRICKGFAFALATHNDEVPYLAQYMFQMFGSRSATSHAGELDLMNEDSLRSLRRHAQQVIIAMAKHAFATKADVETWIAGREAALTVDQARALSNATDWKFIDAQAYVQAIASVLRQLVFEGHLSGAVARKAHALARALLDASRPSETFVRDVSPLLSQLDASHDIVAKKINDATISAADAQTYFDAVIHCLGGCALVQPALNTP